MSKKILLIDDEVKFINFHINYYNDELGEVIHVTNPNEALKIYDHYFLELGLIIVDIMMDDTGFKEGTNEETEYGYSTGLVLIKKFVEIMKEKGRYINIIVTSARKDLPEEISTQVKMKIIKPYFPDSFIKEIKSLFMNDETL